MAASQTFPDIELGVGSGKELIHNVQVASFGDGYTQRFEEGINAERWQWSVVFDNLPPADADTIETFLRARSWSVEAFLWTPPLESVEKQWTLVKGSYKRTPQLGGQTVSLTMSFLEEFDI